jgi:phosphoribosylglycinamide formyltransferase-1
MKIAVLVSGGGTNLQAIIDGINNGTITNTEICLVYSNNPGAYALERAKKAGIPSVCKSPKDYETRDLFNEALLQTLVDADPDLIVLAGCLVVIPESVVKRFQGRIINIHPSLIASFCGTGFYGLKVHEKALERGVRVSGATVHFVDEGTDTGPIILQKPVMIRDDDTAKTLQQRIMEQAEWKILPMAIDLIANGRVSITDGHVVIDGYDDKVLSEL